MDWSEDTGLRDGLRSLPVPDHGPDYLRRRDEALAAVAEPMHNGDTSTHGSARLRVRSRWRRPVVGMTAAFVVLAAGLAIALLATGNGGRTKQVSVPSKTAPGRPIAGAMPAIVGDELSGMARGADGELWAWGQRHFRDAMTAELLERWDGVRWQTVPAPPGFIDGLAALSATDVWVALATDHGGRLAQWNGTAWTAVRAVDFVSTSATSNTLLAISSSDVWAVGLVARFRGQAAASPAEPSRSRMTTLRWDGRQWRSVPTPSLGPGTADVSLRLVRGVSSNDIWALGDYVRFRRKVIHGKVSWTAPRDEEFLLHWNGRRWSRQPWPTAQVSTGPRDSIALDDLAVSSDGVLWCEGRRWFGPDNAGDLFVPVVLRLAGGRWQIMASSASPSLPAHWQAFMPSSISLTSSRDVWIAGQNAGGSATRAILWHWDGAAWNVAALGEAREPEHVAARSVVALTPANVWVLAVRNSNSDTLFQLDSFFLHFDGTTWRHVPAAPQ